MKDFAKAMGIEPALVLPFDAKLFGQAANNGQMLHGREPQGEGRPRASRSSPRAWCARRSSPSLKRRQELTDRLIAAADPRRASEEARRVRQA